MVKKPPMFVIGNDKQGFRPLRRLNQGIVDTRN